MDTRRARGTGSSVGYALSLIGGVAFAVSCFLPFYTVRVQGHVVYQGSLYRDFSHSLIGAWLFLFVGPAVVTFAGIVGLRRDEPGWTRIALVSAAGVWSAMVIGLLLDLGQYSHDVGYWGIWLSVGVALAGVILVVASTTRIKVSAEAQGTTATSPSRDRDPTA